MAVDWLPRTSCGRRTDAAGGAPEGRESTRLRVGLNVYGPNEGDRFWSPSQCVGPRHCRLINPEGEAVLKIAIILLAGQDTPEGAGRMANALTTTQEFQEARDDVRLMFDSARSRGCRD